MAALLHDAAEAYLGDLPHPIKHRSELGASFRDAEKRLEAVIVERFGLCDAAARIKPIDRSLLAAERRIFSRETWHWPELDEAEPLEIEIEAWDPTTRCSSSRSATSASTRSGAASPRRPGAPRGRRPAPRGARRAVARASA